MRDLYHGPRGFASDCALLPSQTKLTSLIFNGSYTNLKVCTHTHTPILKPQWFCDTGYTSFSGVILYVSVATLLNLLTELWASKDRLSAPDRGGGRSCSHLCPPPPPPPDTSAAAGNLRPASLTQSSLSGGLLCAMCPVWSVAGLLPLVLVLVTEAAPRHHTAAVDSDTSAAGRVDVDGVRSNVEDDICCRRERHIVQIGVGEFVAGGFLLVF